MTVSIAETIKNLSRNNFIVHHVETLKDAEKLFMDTILPDINPKLVSYGDSQTLLSTNIIPQLKSAESIEFIDTFDKELTWKEQIYKRKEALSSDLFLTGSNALTEKGQLVNMDMIGNRIGGISFGPRKVVLFISTNKIRKNLEEAMDRVRNIAAPKDVQAHENFKTPCQITGKCSDCNSPQRICNSWLITEKSYPKGRITVILIDQETGY